MADEVVETLKLIWGEMKTLNGKIDRTREELSGRLESLERTTNARFESLERTTNARFQGLVETQDALGDRITESEMRVASEVVSLAGIVRDVRDKILTTGETRMAIVEKRLERVEKRLAQISAGGSSS
jgi:hypothetical protein